MNTAFRQPPDWFALIAIAVTVLLHILLQAERPNLFFIVCVCVFWTGYALFRVLQDRHILAEWGFRRENLWPTAAISAILLIVVAGGFAAYAIARGTFQFPAHTLLLMLLYPLYGLVQQFLALGIVVQNLGRLGYLDRRPALLVLLGAVIFALVHWHDRSEMAATFCLELVLIPVFLRYRNLWPLGAIHGWLGGLFYLWVMDRDLWTANFGG